MTNPDKTNVGSLGATTAAPPTASPHDTLFYKTFGNAQRAAAALRGILAKDLTKVFQWRTLRVEPNRFVDPNLGNHFADILLSVRVRRSKTYIHLLYEHSSSPKSHELLQALRYQVRLWEKEEHTPNDDGPRTLTPVITEILHHSETGWRGCHRFSDYFGLDDDLAAILRRYLVDFRVFVDDLSPLDAETLLSRPVPPEVHVVLFALRFGRSGPRLLGELPKIAPVLGKLWPEPTGRLVIQSFFVYMNRVAKVSEAQIRMALQDVFEPVLDPEIAAIWEQFEAGERKGLAEGERRGIVKGERRGERRGERKGIVKGKVDTLMRLLGQRFGPLPPHALAKLKHVTLQELEGIELRVLTAPTLEEALGLPANATT